VQIAAAANIGSNGSFVVTNAQVFGIFVGIVLTHALVCSLGTSVLARLQTVYVGLNVLLVRRLAS
jgi:hypothetical protein